jgi:L-glyceraldehyde 3-phosphate reductase
VSQIEDCAAAVGNLEFTTDELAEIDRLADEEGFKAWAEA